jgi:2-polyprenyl-3-methyl-5-hydroxy-6-metoxy-1,4-benzoquinol methylase
MIEDHKAHWEHIYQHKQPYEVSWTQEKPHLSLQLIHQYHPEKDAAIIDVGGGDSRLVDYLLDEGFTNLTVLDISESAIHRARVRLGEKANSVHWIVCDIRDFKPDTIYNIWHDRAAFHFLTHEKDLETYIQLIEKAVSGHLVIGTFSVDGPKKCSGLEISQYDEQKMTVLFETAQFQKEDCLREDHITPAGATQNFVFCTFFKK